MRAITFAVSLLAVSALLGQDAKIIIVERHDTTSLKSAYADYKAAQSKWERVKNEVAKKYTFENGKTLEGWDKVEFSVDFRALVPQRAVYGANSYWGNVISTIPAIGTLQTGILTTNGTTGSADSVRADLTVRETSNASGTGSSYTDPITNSTTYGDQSPVISGNSGTIVMDMETCGWSVGGPTHPCKKITSSGTVK